MAIQVNTDGRLTRAFDNDWIGPGIAERLVRAGHQVQLAVNGTHCGENLPLYVRDHLAGELHKLGVPITPYARLYGCDDNTVYLQHTASGEPMLLENIDTLVLCQGHQPLDTLGAEVQDLVEIRRIGEQSLITRNKMRVDLVAEFFVRVVATDEDESRPVAMGAGAFTLDRPQGLSAEGMVI